MSGDFPGDPAAYPADSNPYLPTVPGTQLVIAGKWCAGHARLRGRLWWLHRALHRAHLLSDRDAKPVLHYYPDPKARERQAPDA